MMNYELESEFNSRYDYMTEAFGPTARDAEKFCREEAEADMLACIKTEDPEFYSLLIAEGQA